jgi:hypothetical protein
MFLLLKGIKNIIMQTKHTESSLNDAHEKVRSLRVENKKLRLWVYKFVDASTLFGVMLICFFLLSKVIFER